MSKKLFKIARSGRVIGDFTAKQICEGILSGHFLGTDHYWDPELEAWRFVREKDWHASTEEIEPKEKSVWTKPIKGLSFLDFNYGWWIVGIPLGIYRLCFKNSRSGSDSQIVGWTLIAGLIATFLYFVLREDDGKNTDQAEKENNEPRFLWTGYAVMLMAIILTGASFTKRGQQALRDFNPLRDDFRYEVWSDFDREIFPCFEISFSKLNEAAMEKLMEPEKGEAHEFNQEKSGGTIGLRLFDVRKGDRFEIKVQSDGRTPLISESTYAFTADQDYAHSIAYPRLTYDYAQLRAATQTRPINLKITASRNGGSPITVTQTWHLRQINDCPIGIRSRTLQSDGSIKNETLNVAIMTFPGYVNENHPSIPRILDEALSEGRLEAFSGYQEGTQVSVLLQLTAIWKALEKKGIRYSSIGTTTGSSTAVQHVRLIEDTLSTRQANCVDGSTLFASIATKIGLDAYLVLTPGHCYVAIDMPDTKPIGIEMTMLGSSSFLEAMAMATNKGEYSLRRNEKKFEDADPDSGYLVVPIATCRELGIQPIPASK
jgi:hypothetical protein